MRPRMVWLAHQRVADERGDCFGDGIFGLLVGRSRWRQALQLGKDKERLLRQRHIYFDPARESRERVAVVGFDPSSV